MNLFINALGVLIFAILAVSFIYTVIVGRKQKVTDGDMDTHISKPIQEHVYIKNPVFLAYGIFFALLLFIVLFVAITFLK